LKALISTATKRTERVFLVGVELKSRSASDIHDSLDELSELAATAGGEVLGHGIQKMEAPVAGTFIGSGKAEEFAQHCRRNDVDTVIFDDELSPAQSRNLERVFDCKVLDRTSLILDIFAQRARTKEGKLQIELAQLQHLLPRLTRFWGHLSRQKGGIGMRGDGETQLETDRRRVQDRIAKIARELEVVRRQRSTQRQGRQRNLWPLASIVGYTNAGKSTLLNALTGAEVLAEDKLFATLDPTTRRLKLPTNQNVLLTDTVGFIRKLPHGLVEAFKATLEEVVRADLLLHVVDVSHPQAEEQIHAVNTVLEEIGASGKPTLMIFNKVDRLNSEGAGNIQRFYERHANAVGVSAKTGEGLPALLAELNSQVRPIREFMELAVPHEASAVIARLHAVGQVIARDYNGAKAWFKVRIPPHLHEEFAPFIVQELQTA
jgi:GTPase